MLDDLRNSAESSYIEEDPLDSVQVEKPKKTSKGPLFGMSASQRFVIALFVFLMVAILGVFLLILFEKVFPPI